jgi:hypothetical protein
MPVPVNHGHPASYIAPDRLQDRDGLYFFSRRHGYGDYEPFYVGQTVHLRTRLDQYIHGKGRHESRIRNVIEGGLDAYSQVQLSNGPRFFHFGYLAPRSGQKTETTLDRAERALIQYARIVGWRLINNHHAGDAAFRKFDMGGSRFGGVLPSVLVAHR